VSILGPAQNELERTRIRSRISLTNVIGIDDSGQLEVIAALLREPRPCGFGFCDQSIGNGLFYLGHDSISILCVIAYYL